MGDQRAGWAAWCLAGWLLLAAGVAAMVLPGPGLLLLAGGLTILSQQYEWAERRLEPVKQKANEVAEASVSSWRNITLSVVSAAALVAVGLVWGLRPAPPSFWPLGEKWWLLGGWGTGSSLMGSGLIAVGLLIYSYRRFRGEPEESR